MKHVATTHATHITSWTFVLRPLVICFRAEASEAIPELDVLPTALRLGDRVVHRQ